MSNSLHIKNELAQSASANVQDELARLQDPRSWVRLQKYMDIDGVIVRDYIAGGTEVAARVRERTGKVMDVALMTVDALTNLRHSETKVDGREWDAVPTPAASKIAYRTREFGFGMGKEQGTKLPCVLITPVSYFYRTNESWAGELPVENALPDWLVRLAPGVYQTDGRDYDAIAEELLLCGFIELDSLSSYHDEQIALSINAAHDENNL